MRDRSEYLQLRRAYQPAVVRLVIVAESPPASGLYFYDPEGRVSEPIFAAFMKLLLLSPLNKANGLRALQDRGWILVDATYEPIDKKFKARDKARDAVLVRDYPLLKRDILELSRGEPVPIVLIKENVCRVLEPLLVQDKFPILNRGRRVYLPMQGNQPQFHRVFGEILQEFGTEN
jgi:hypothetical protein